MCYVVVPVYGTWCELRAYIHIKGCALPPSSLFYLRMLGIYIGCDCSLSLGSCLPTCPRGSP